MKKLTLAMLLLAALALPMAGCTGAEQTPDQPQISVTTYDYDLDINFLRHIDSDTYVSIANTTKDGEPCTDVRLVNIGESRVAPGWITPAHDAFADPYCMPTDTGLLLLNKKSGAMLQANTATGTITEYAIHDDVATTEHRISYSMGDHWLVCDLYAQPGEWHRTGTSFGLWDATFRSTSHLLTVPGGISDVEWSTDDEQLYVLTYEGTAIAVDPILHGGIARQYNFAAAAPQSDDIGVLGYTEILPIDGTDLLALHLSCETGNRLLLMDTKEYAEVAVIPCNQEALLLGAYQSNIYILGYYQDLNDNTCCTVMRYDCLTNERTTLFDTANWQQMAEPGRLILDGGSVSPDGSHLLLEGLYYTTSTLSHIDPAEQVLLRLELE